ncbi:hypothetical protein Taro_011434 [Colocasia esculenta]|uniref:Uncharacterized protein n=1 Tax=Colocasia esculenta TaxID=4460 RepID=A0A843U9W5_COLES|nr:hypothetical protein [Colocasia esculenta]
MYTISYVFLNDPVSKSDLSGPQSKIEQNSVRLSPRT